MNFHWIPRNPRKVDLVLFLLMFGHPGSLSIKVAAVGDHLILRNLRNLPRIKEVTLLLRRSCADVAPTSPRRRLDVASTQCRTWTARELSFEQGIACSNAMPGAKPPHHLPSSSAKGDESTSTARFFIVIQYFLPLRRGVACRLTHASASQ